MSIYEKKQRWKFLLLLSAFLIGAGSLLYTGRLVNSIAEDERKKIELWAEATRILANPDLSGNDIFFPLKVIENNTQIPVIVTDANGIIMAHRNLDSTKLDHPFYLNVSLEKMKSENDSIIIDLGNNNYQYLYYRNSKLLTKLAAFPYFQMAVIILFITVSYIAFSISRKAEQNKVWNGLSKETAHQLGTPISSLAGWIEILKKTGADQTATTELEKDSERLIKIADRFSKIGSKPDLKKQDIIHLINNSVSYIKTRQSKLVEFQTVFPSEPLLIPVNEILLDWVIENLCKNAIDAMEGSGRIKIQCIPTEKHIMIDIEDSGKGIPKAKFKTVFKPGFTTKKRGWGLGLSLVKRIIETYHDGRIYVSSSDPGKRTVFRIILNR